VGYCCGLVIGAVGIISAFGLLMMNPAGSVFFLLITVLGQASQDVDPGPTDPPAAVQPATPQR
jgi:hypothetical protein